MRPAAVLPWLALPALAAAASLALGAHGERLIALSGVYALATIGYQAIFGAAGALSLAQGAFFGVGAYAVAILATRWGLPPAAALPAAGLAAAALALIVALPVLRLESHYFALATLGLAEIAHLAAVNWEAVTGGANGIAGVPGFGLGRGWPQILAVWSLVAAAGLGFGALFGGARGRRYRLLRDAPLAAATAGVDGGRLRLAAFVASAAAAGLAGGLYAPMLHVVSPAATDFSIMVSLLAMAVIGGRGSAGGAVLGAVLLVHLPEWLRGFEVAYLLAYGVALLAAVILLPAGLAGLAARRRGEPAPPTAAPAAAPLRPATLAVRGLVRRFGGVEALAGVDLDLAGGGIVGLIGANGSGKTTLINVVSGLVAADGGTARLDGADLLALPAHRRAAAGIARSFQSPQLMWEETALANVAVAVSAPGADPRAAAAGILADLDLLGNASDRADSLPPGGRRRLELARALAGAPRLLLLDEPAAGLDDRERHLVAELLRRRAEAGLAILLVEHRLDFLVPLADRLVCLEAGRVIAAGAPAAVLADPAVRRAYVDPVPEAGG